MGLRAVGIGRGDEVIFCSHTMVATAAAIHFTGAVPIPVECGADHLIDPEAVERAITSRTRALLPTQLNGRTADMDALDRIASEHGLKMIEDAAQALGSKFRGRAAGSFGHAAAVSFFPAKVLGCLGDGGAVLTNDDQMYDRMLQLRDHGRRADGEIVSWGLNSRLDNLQAAVLDHRLKVHDQVIERRRWLAQLYSDRLWGIQQVILPPTDDDHFDIFQNYEIEADRRNELRAFLKLRGIGTALPWGGKAVHQWTGLGFDVNLPFTEGVFARVLLLPLNLSLADDDVQQVCDAIETFYRLAA
jgi:dTDP-4-amino-4,6-dideoxygalactose transaminase